MRRQWPHGVTGRCRAYVPDVVSLGALRHVAKGAELTGALAPHGTIGIVLGSVDR